MDREKENLPNPEERKPAEGEAQPAPENGRDGVQPVPENEDTLPSGQRLEGEEEEFDPDFATVPERVEAHFKVTYDDMMKGLGETDKVDGTQRKNKIRYGMLLILAVLELIAFMQSRNGFALILAFVFGGMAIYLQKRGMGVNHRIAKQFEAEEGQSLVLTPEGMEVTGKKVGYQEDVHVYELDEFFSMIYQKNHVFVIPKRHLTPEQTYGIKRKLKGALGNSYEDMTTAE